VTAGCGVADPEIKSQPPQLATTRHSATRPGGTNGNTAHHRSRDRSDCDHHRIIIAMAERPTRRTDPRSDAIRKQATENSKGDTQVKYREPLFSVHGNEGRLAIYLEEQDAVVDLIEETGKEVHPDYIADLAVYGKIENLKTEEGFDTYSKHRDKLDPTVLLIANMSQDEALTLAEQILITVRAMKEPTAPRLEIVK
jgi:hypothetical protein